MGGANETGSDLHLASVIRFDPEKTLAAPSPSASPSRPDWVPAADLAQGSEPSVPPDMVIEVEIEEDEYVGVTLGKYLLKELIGQGGMGKVYLAEHTRIGRLAAIKLLRSRYAKRKDIVHRFFQEARAVNQIKHDNIVQITDFVEADEHNQATYLVMEYLEGESLGSFLKRNRYLTVTQALNIFIQICSALEAAHLVGVVHRDLKPDNMFLVNRVDSWGHRNDFVKLLDFGVAKLMGDALAEKMGRVMVGTPAYMAPEQALAKEVDHRADIYAMGAIMYRVLCGRPVFQGTTIQEYVRKHIQATPIPPAEVVAELGQTIPAALEGSILKCLEKSPAHRFQSIRELREELIAIQLAMITPQNQPTAALTPARRSRRSARVAAGIMLLLTAVGLTAIFWPRASEVVQPPAPLPVPTHAPQPVPAPVIDNAPKMMELYIVSRPLGAQVFRADGQGQDSLGTTPFRLRVASDTKEINLMFQLENHVEKQVQVHPAEGADVDVVLERVRTANKSTTRKQTGPARTRPIGKKGRIERNETLDPFAN